MKTVQRSSLYPGGRGTSPARIALRDGGEGRCQRYVVHYYNAEFEGYSDGFYTDDLDRARANYEERCARLGVEPYPDPPRLELGSRLVLRGDPSNVDATVTCTSVDCRVAVVRSDVRPGQSFFAQTRYLRSSGIAEATPVPLIRDEPRRATPVPLIRDEPRRATPVPA